MDSTLCFVNISASALDVVGYAQYKHVWGGQQVHCDKLTSVCSPLSLFSAVDSQNHLFSILPLCGLYSYSKMKMCL